MRKSSPIARASADEARAMLNNNADRSDWHRVRTTPPSEIERLADAQDGALPADWSESIVMGIPEQKQSVHIRLDPAVLRWFKAYGPGYQTRINAVLSEFVRLRGGKA